MRYLNKVVFINSASVKYAEIAIEGNVHFIGTQGVGKSTLLRAILFFYNADKLKLGIEKSKKTFDEYYFPYGNSYVIYEVMRDEVPYCIMAFKAQGRVCFRFINSGYDQPHFVDGEGKARLWDGIRDSFGKRVSYSKKIDRYEEYRDILYGNNAGLEKEFRKYTLIESKQYQNIPRTIQNVFLNSKLDAEFIKQTIIMSLNEEDVKIDLDKYLLHLKDFDTQLEDINKWTVATNKNGEIPVRRMAENIARIHAAIQSLGREQQEIAIRLFHVHHAAIAALPQLEKEHSNNTGQLQQVQDKARELQGKFQARRDELQKLISILDSDLKRAKSKADDYERMNIADILARVGRREETEAARTRLLKEQELLNAKFTEINILYDAKVQQQQNSMAEAHNTHNAQKNKHQEALLQYRTELGAQYRDALAAIQAQHRQTLEVSRNGIAHRKDVIHDLKLKKQRAGLQRYYEQETEAAKDDIAALQQKIKTTTVDIADYKKQADALQKQWELDTEKSAANYDRKTDKLWETIKQLQGSAEAIDARLAQHAGSLYGWLGDNMPGWENTIGKVIDDSQVLFHTGLSPQLAEGGGDTLFGVKIDLEEIGRSVKTVSEYEQERAQLQKQLEAARASITDLTAQKNDEADKLRTRSRNKIKELNDARRQMDYALEKAKGQLQAAGVLLADWQRKGAAEKEQQLQAVTQEIEAASEALIQEQESYKAIEAGMQKQTEAKEKEQRKREKAEEQRVKELLAGMEEELNARQQQAGERMAEIKLQQTQSLKQEGADTVRIAAIASELTALQKELQFIDDNRDRAAEYKKDKRELFDNTDSFKAEKKLKETQLANEQDKHGVQRQKLEQETTLLTGTLSVLGNKMAAVNEGLAAFERFRLTDNYKLVAALEGQEEAAAESNASLQQLIEELYRIMQTMQNRYNDLQAASNRFLGEFHDGNIFGFKKNVAERAELVEFAIMLNEFLEEDKITQYEKRVNERFAMLIRQIGKETTDLTSKGGEIQKVITEINRDFEERNFAGVIKSIRLQLSGSQNEIVATLQEIKQFNDKHAMSLGVVNLFSSGDSDGQNRNAVSLLKKFHKEITARKEKEISLPDSFDLQFRIVENENDSGWVDKLSNVGSEGTDILVKAMVNIMLLNVFKDSASKRFKDFRLHCMMDEIGKLHPNNVKGILKFANDRNILLINSSPTSYNATDYRYTYLLSKDSTHVTTVKRLVKKVSEPA